MGCGRLSADELPGPPAVNRATITTDPGDKDAPQAVRRAVGRAGIDRARAIIAGGWFRWGNIPRALALAGAAAKRSGKAAPGAQWWAGPAAFKLHRSDQAAGYFAAAARRPAPAPPAAPRAAVPLAPVRRIASDATIAYIPDAAPGGVPPRHIRLRKRSLSPHERKRQARQAVIA